MAQGAKRTERPAPGAATAPAAPMVAPPAGAARLGDRLRAGRRWLALCGLCLLGAALVPSAVARAETPEIAAARAAQRTDFSDREITEGFFKLAFGAELNSGGGAVDRIRRFEGPVRIFVSGRGPADRVAAIARVVADIRAKIPTLDIALTSSAAGANVTVHLVRDQDLAAAIRRRYGPEESRRIMRRLEPQCLSGFSRNTRFQITRGDVFLVTDRGDFTFYDCAYEEMLQVLGPINDDSSVPWTMFNDDVDKGYFDVYDQYILNILYHPAIRAGMTRAEVTDLMPRVLADVRRGVIARLPDSVGFGRARQPVLPRDPASGVRRP